MGILPNESRVVSEEEDNNNGTMSEGKEGDYEGVWVVKTGRGNNLPAAECKGF